MEVCGGRDTHGGENVKIGGGGGNCDFALIAFVMFGFAARVCIIFAVTNNY